VVLSLYVHPSEYDRQAQRALLTRIARLLEVPPSRLRATSPSAVQEAARTTDRADGLLDIEITILADEPDQMGWSDETTEETTDDTAWWDEPMLNTALELLTSPCAPRPPCVPGPCASKPAEQAARELVRCGTGRLSFELMVPVSDVALVGLSDDESESEDGRWSSTASRLGHWLRTSPLGWLLLVALAVALAVALVAAARRAQSKARAYPTHTRLGGRRSGRPLLRNMLQRLQSRGAGDSMEDATFVCPEHSGALDGFEDSSSGAPRAARGGARLLSVVELRHL